MEKNTHAIPSELYIASTWYGPDMDQRKGEWIIELNINEIAELEKAAEPLSGSEKNIASLTAVGFPLPTLGKKLQALREELIHGRGFALLRGLPIAKYNEREAGTIFYGLGCHLGSPRSCGRVIVHSLQYVPGNAKARPQRRSSFGTNQPARAHDERTCTGATSRVRADTSRRL